MRNVGRRFGTVAALDNVDFEIERGEFFSLLGPSGCGKTTLLRLIAGLDFPDSGRLTVLGREAIDFPAHQRPVNTVFQSYALFPHMTVWENVAFGLRMKRRGETEILERVGRVMETVQIRELAERKPSEISGGQKQRVALARAVVNEPEILLLDEPLGALDLKLRKELQVELHQLQRRLGITFIYVTHDQDEALTMSDRVAVMNKGRIAQLGTPEDLYETPCNRFVAEFLGSCNLIKGVVRSTSAGHFEIATEYGQLTVRTSKVTKVGEKITVGIRPEKISMGSQADPAQPNQVSATIEEVIYGGAESRYFLRNPHGRFRSCVFNGVGHQRFSSGDSVVLQLRPEALIVLDD